ncbi:MAG: ImmA/IrrE family metallo-endopeptidase [Patescibacteria group bacterium]|nr:ImmA/IrrE family metallo-endopeptidase [Patescibacteria group bacterium]MDD5554404.1 ImmA/IrrE family metallo-endopeptidase [Patescibacteria group bacterium]
MFKINPSRLRYLLDLYKLSKGEFLNLLNRNKKRDVVSLESLNEILDQREKVSESLLKRIDKIFEKGISWYVTNRGIPDVKKSSIFFRKDIFNSEIKLESIKIVNKYEELSTDIKILGNYINFVSVKTIKRYKLVDNPENVALEISSLVLKIENDLIEKKIIQKIKLGDSRGYLKNLIRTLEQLDIFVFEHLEMPRKKDKVNFNGFFIGPNMIVIKKQHIRREIFTLVHEFSHYILEQEEIDDVIEEKTNFNKNKVEQWCNTFAFYFLLNNQKDKFKKLGQASKNNNFYREAIEYLHNNTFLSYSAFYTRLRIEEKISEKDYKKIMEEISQIIKKNKEEEKEKRRRENEKRVAAGKEPIHPTFKAIESSLLKELVKINYFEGNINENSLREYLKIKPEKNIIDVIY